MKRKLPEDDSVSVCLRISELHVLNVTKQDDSHGMHGSAAPLSHSLLLFLLLLLLIHR